MLQYLEVYKLDAEFKWVELKAADELHPDTTTIRLIVGDDFQKMARDFLSRYASKRQDPLSLPDSQLHMVKELCEEAAMAHVLFMEGKASPDLLDLLPTTVIHFKYPEKTSFRKSRAARITMFTDEAMDALGERDFEHAMNRLNWVHLLDKTNESAFQWKVVCLRSWKKPAECVPVFEQWIEAHPTRMEPRLGLSEMWLYLGQNQRALDLFQELLAEDKNNTMALIGMAQARSRIGEDPIPELRKAWMIDPTYTVEMIEHQMDFRLANASDLVPGTLKEISKAYQIPMTRVLERAERGVLPIHPPGESGLPRFSKQELDRHYQVLKCVGLEIPMRVTQPLEPKAVQQSLFSEELEE